MQIAEIQESQTEVRWEHEDDVSKCRKCKQPLRVHKEKVGLFCVYDNIVNRKDNGRNVQSWLFSK